MAVAFVALIVALVLATVVAAALSVSLAGVLQHALAARLSAEARVVAVLAVIAAGALLSVALSPRVLDEAHRDLGGFVPYADFAGGFAASRWLSLLLIAAAAIEAIRGWVASQGDLAPDPARWVLRAMLAFHLGTLAVLGLASEHPGFSHKDLYVPIVLLALGYQRIERLDAVLRWAKWLLFALMAGSLMAAVADPDFAIHRPEAGVLPGIDWRLFGLASHANTLGPAALLAIVLELYAPSSRPIARSLHLLAALLVILLAQSRTAWGAGLALVACVGVPVALSMASLRPHRPRAFRRATWTLLGCIAALIVLSMALSSHGAIDALARKLELATLNGRMLIWDITLQAWHENPAFGWGPEVWGLERQWRFHMFHVGHAHNQVVQTLGEAGLAGLALLAFYVGVLATAALSRFTASRGLLLALLVVLAARFVTEAPMRAEGVLSWTAFHQALIIVATCAYLRNHAIDRRRRSSAVVTGGAVAAPAFGMR